MCDSESNDDDDNDDDDDDDDDVVGDFVRAALFILLLVEVFTIRSTIDILAMCMFDE